MLQLLSCKHTSNFGCCSCFTERQRKNSDLPAELLTNFCVPRFFLVILADSWLAIWVAVLSKVLFFSPQGVDSAILASQPFLLITKPREENRTHPPLFFLKVFLLLLLCQFWSKDTGETAPVPEKNKRMTFNSPFPVRETADIQGLASVLRAH